MSYTRVENPALIFRQRDGQLVVCLDQSEERILVGGRVIGIYVGLHGTGCRLASHRELLDQIVAKHLRWRRRLDELEEQLRGCPRLRNARGEFIGRRQGRRPRGVARAVVEVILMLGIVILRNNSLLCMSSAGVGKT